MRVGQIFIEKRRGIKCQVCFITDYLRISGNWITERVISYHQVSCPDITYANLENDFIEEYESEKQTR